MEKDKHVGGSFLRLFAEIKSLSRDAFGILSASWRVGTGERFNSCIERCVKLNHERYTDPIQATTEMEINFFTEYFKTGAGYSSVNSTGSSLSSIIKLVSSVAFANAPLVCRLLKEIFNITPVFLRYVTTYDITKVFTFIKSKPALTDSDLKTLSYRLAILLCSTTGQREQTIKCLTFYCINLSNDKIVFFVPKILESTRTGYQLKK